MIDIDKSVAANGKKIYSEIEQTLKLNYPGQYVAIEPISGEYYVDRTMGGALSRGKAIYPSRQFYTIGIERPVHIPVR